MVEQPNMVYMILALVYIFTFAYILTGIIKGIMWLIEYIKDNKNFKKSEKEEFIDKD